MFAHILPRPQLKLQAANLGLVVMKNPMMKKMGPMMRATTCFSSKASSSVGR
jgi:hypothetical protein